MTDDKSEDFYVRYFERRNPERYGNRHTDNHQPPCTPLRIMAGNIMDFKECVKELRDSIKELGDKQQDLIEDQREFREDLLGRMSHLENTITAQKSFVSGAGWILGIVIAAGVWLIDKLSPHIKL